MSWGTWLSHTICGLPPPSKSFSISQPWWGWYNGFKVCSIDLPPQTALGQHQFIALLSFPVLSTWYHVSSFLRVTTASSMYVRGAYGWLRQGLLDWFVAPTSALYHPTVSVCFAPLCLCAPHILFFNSFSLLTCQSVPSEAAGGEYLHKYWTKTGRNSRTATGLILDKYFTRPTNTPGGGGGVWGAWRMRRILANTHWGGM